MKKYFKCYKNISQRFAFSDQKGPLEAVHKDIKQCLETSPSHPFLTSVDQQAVTKIF